MLIPISRSYFSVNLEFNYFRVHSHFIHTILKTPWSLASKIKLSPAGRQHTKSEARPRFRGDEHTFIQHHPQYLFSETALGPERLEDFTPTSSYKTLQYLGASFSPCSLIQSCRFHCNHIMRESLTLHLGKGQTAQVSCNRHFKDATTFKNV